MYKRVLSLCLVVLVVALMLAAPSFAGANSHLKVAIHMKTHGACKQRPTLTWCGDIYPQYAGCADTDALPVFYNLTEYTSVEFGMTWPAEWGTSSWMICWGSEGIGGIIDPGDGTRVQWSTCQTDWYVIPGMAWLYTSTPGHIRIVPNPATGNLGVFDCSETPGPQMDSPIGIFRGGACGAQGDDPCSYATEPTTWGSIKAMVR